MSSDTTTSEHATTDGDAPSSTRRRRTTLRDPETLPGIRPWSVPLAATLAIVVMFAAILLIDVQGMFGGIPAMEATGLAPPAVWFQMFQDRGVAEFLQWGLFGWFIILAATLRGRAAGRETGVDRFWALTAVFGVLLLLEDAGGVRDTLAHWGDALLPGSRSGLLLMVLWFAVIAAVLGWALLRHGREVVGRPGVAGYGIAGIGMFAIASIGEALEHVVGWMGPAGWWLVNDVLAAPHILRLPQHEMDYLVYLFADFAIEEPLELLGIAFLTAAVLAYARDVRVREARSDRAPSSERSPDPT